MKHYIQIIKLYVKMVYAHFPVYLSDDCYLCVIESLSAGARVVSEQATNQSKTDNNEWEKIIFHPKKLNSVYLHT